MEEQHIGLPKSFAMGDTYEWLRLSAQICKLKESSNSSFETSDGGTRGTTERLYYCERLVQ